MTKVFLDASILMAALASKKGGSRKILKLSEEKRFLSIVSQTVVNETVGNIDKLRGVTTDNLWEIIKNSNIIVRRKITREEIEPFVGIVDEKDAHVLAGASLTNCDFLVILDKKHLLKDSVKSKIKRPRIVSPKEFLELLA